MHIPLALLCLVTQLDIYGYVETRPNLLWNDSIHVAGYNRGWLELKTDGPDYGTQLALDLLMPYDTISFIYATEHIKISRLALWLGPENMRVIVGKQKLYGGVARVFRPLDIFNPVNYFEPAYERAGRTAILGYIALGRLTSIRGIHIPQYDVEESISGLRIGTNIFKNDIGLSVLHQVSEEKTILGAEIAGELEIGYWGEYTYTLEDTTDYSKFTLGVDYSFPLSLYTMVEYFFDGSGVSDPQYYDFTEILQGRRSTLARHYLYFTIGRIANPFDIIQPAINTLVNLNDRGSIIIPQVRLALLENTDITVGLNYFIGSDESEFTNIVPFDGAVYVWAKVYF